MLFIIISKDNEIRKKGTFKIYKSKECQKCRYIVECAKNEYGRKLEDKFDPILDEIKKEYYTEYGQTAYSGRGSHAEGGFGILLESRNFRGIKTKGVKKANNEMTRTTITHNIKKNTQTHQQQNPKQNIKRNKERKTKTTSKYEHI